MTSSDAIAWLKAIKIKYIHGGDEDFDTKRHEAIDLAIEALKILDEFSDRVRNFNLQSKTSKNETKWVKIFENPFTNGYVCPFCGHKIQVTEQFLPEVTECEVCGADMKGGAE